MPAVLPFVLVGIVLLVLAVAAVVVLIRQKAQREGEVVDRPESERLSYQVPEGQDPAVVLTALEQEGYRPVAHGAEIVVPCPDGREADRSHVRAAIASAPLNTQGDPSPRADVRFTDE